MGGDERGFGEQPPRARGRAGSRYLRVVVERATPASAGPSPCRWPRGVRPTSNPRERGAESSPQPRPPLSREQPPRARGRVHDVLDVDPGPGATPASAGPRRFSVTTTAPVASNPRERGAECRTANSRAMSVEQPPRARGRDRLHLHQRRQPGATPASAGPSDEPPCYACNGRSNPRERGAEITTQLGLRWTREQPPRARGRVGVALGSGRLLGATPASAGPSPQHHRLRHHDRSNPRERGAEEGHDVLPSAVPEQPPRARGRDVDTRLMESTSRATPASAGPRLDELVFCGLGGSIFVS